MAHYPIPPVVQDMIDKLNSASVSVVEKDNICSVLEEVEKACCKETVRHRSARAKEFEAERTATRKSRTRRILQSR